MIDLFVKRNGVAVPELTPGAEWVLERPSVVHRHHEGINVELRQRFGFKRWYFEREFDIWRPVSTSVKGLYVKEALKFPPFDSYLQKYIPGFYTLINTSIFSTGSPRLVPDKYAIQLGNFQNLELDLVRDVEQAYNDLKETFTYVDEPVIVFKSLDFTQRVKLQRSDFGVL